MTSLVPSDFEHGNLISRARSMKAVLDLAVKSVPVPEIASELGMTEAKVKSLMQDALSAYAPAMAKSVDQVRQIMTAQIDAMQRTLHTAFEDAATDGHVGAMEKAANAIYKGMRLKVDINGLQAQPNSKLPIGSFEELLALPWNSLSKEELDAISSGEATPLSVFSKYIKAGDATSGDEEV